MVSIEIDICMCTLFINLTYCKDSPTWSVHGVINRLNALIVDCSSEVVF